MGTHNPDKQESTYGFIKRLGREHEDLANLARDLAELGRLAAENMPVSSRLATEMIDGAAEAGRLAQDAQTWQPVARAKQQRDVDRVEAPRGGSRRKERAADVGKALRET